MPRSGSRWLSWPCRRLLAGGTQHWTVTAAPCTSTAGARASWASPAQWPTWPTWWPVLRRPLLRQEVGGLAGGGLAGATHGDIQGVPHCGSPVLEKCTACSPALHFCVHHLIAPSAAASGWHVLGKQLYQSTVLPQCSHGPVAAPGPPLPDCCASLLRPAAGPDVLVPPVTIEAEFKRPTLLPTQLLVLQQAGQAGEDWGKALAGPAGYQFKLTGAKAGRDVMLGCIRSG